MNNWLNKDKEHVWHPFTPLEGSPDPIFITHGEGVYLHTSDNRKILDGISSWWVNIHGHANPVLAEALATQARTLEHVIFAGFTHAPAIQLAENLLQILPSNQHKLFFSDNGSTAVEVGIKMAIQFRKHKGLGGNRIIALDGAYHGDTFGAMSVGERGLFTDPFSSLLFDVDFIPFPEPNQEERCIETFRQLVEKGDTAIFIYEPLVQGAAGMRMYSPEALNSLLTLAKQHGVTCIADEVFTGFCRTGRYFASDYIDTKPDIMAISKGITGGTMPLGVTTCTREIVEAFQSPDITKTFFHGHSYTANPLSCAVANASFTLLTSESCQQQIQRISKAHERFATEISSHPRVRVARHIGTILAIELASAQQTSYTHELRKKISGYFLSRDILLRPLGNILYFLPPYVIQEHELTHVYNAIRDFLNELQ